GLRLKLSQTAVAVNSQHFAIRRRTRPAWNKRRLPVHDRRHPVFVLHSRSRHVSNTAILVIASHPLSDPGKVFSGDPWTRSVIKGRLRGESVGSRRRQKLACLVVNPLRADCQPACCHDLAAHIAEDVIVISDDLVRITTTPTDRFLIYSKHFI